MENIYKKIETELNTLSFQEREEILTKLRTEVDLIDKEIVKLLSSRTLHSVLIGRVKRSMGLPTYSPKREKEIAEKISNYFKEPLSREALLRIYERIIDESRAIQREEANRGNIFNISSAFVKKGFGKLFNKKELLLVIFFFIIILTLLYYTFFTSNYYSGNSPVRFEIKRGETFNSVVEKLYNEGIIPSKFNMKTAAFIYSAEKRIRAARYDIPNGLSYLELIDLFVKGDADFLVQVNVYNGSTLPWLASRLRREARIDSVSFIQKAIDKNFVQSLGLNANTVEGYLFPRDYFLYERSNPKEVIELFVNGFRNFMTDSLIKRSESLGFSIHKIITLASIIEGETNKVEEMPVISGVYHNRLKAGMKLQADPTVQYLQMNGWKRLLYNDLQIDSPYNTYRYHGLPPGPINNPGKAAILASLYPQKHNYFFFVADSKGGHKFAENYAQHLRYVREYREWLRNQKNN
jgi:UPF0755 protein